MAGELSGRVKMRDAQLRTAFAEQRDSDGPDTPLARILRGGRGGEVRLKLLLSLLWIAVQEPHDVALPGRVWAELFGLDDPTSNGARRVAAAFRWLVKENFLDAKEEPGKPTRLLLKEETGLDRPYRIPGARIGQLRRAGQDWEVHRYVKIPKEVWTNGWIASLSGPALAMLLVLIVHARGGGQTDLWFAPNFADQRYRLSEDTRQRGLADLGTLQLVTIGKRPISRNRLTTVRLRNTYTLNDDALHAPAPTILPPRRTRTSDHETPPTTRIASPAPF